MDRTLFLPVNVVFLTVFLPLATAWGVQSGSGTQGGAHRSGPGVCTLALGPMAATEEAEQLRLLPELEGQSAKDAYPIYQEAISVLGPGVPFRQILDWLKGEGPAFPMEEALQTLAPYQSVLVLLERASKCRQCNWPKIKVGVMVPHLTEMRYLIALVALQARIHIEERRFSEAAVALQAGMALTRHLGQAPLVIQGTVAMAMEGVLCRQLRHRVQGTWIAKPLWAHSRIATVTRGH